MLGAFTRVVLGIDSVLRRHAPETAYRLLEGVDAHLTLLEVEYSGPFAVPPGESDAHASLAVAVAGVV